MTEKQARFVDEYLVDCNITQAAIRAGYSEKTAYSIGSENLRKPEIQEAIKARLAELQSKKVATVQEIMEYLTPSVRPCFSDNSIIPQNYRIKHDIFSLPRYFFGGTLICLIALACIR